MKPRNALEGPSAAARREARRLGVCPVTQLDDWFAGHWDFDTLCSGFGCRECVADPADMGPTEPWREPECEPGDDVPF